MEDKQAQRTEDVLEMSSATSALRQLENSDSNMHLQLQAGITQSLQTDYTFPGPSSQLSVGKWIALEASSGFPLQSPASIFGVLETLSIDHGMAQEIDMHLLTNESQETK